MIPIRCFSCSAVIADKYDKYIEHIKNGKTANESMNLLNIKRYCCRRMFLGTVELDITEYKELKKN